MDASNETTEKNIVIVGGGFGGIETALELAKKDIKGARIRLISAASHFEYTPTLYRVVTGESPLEVCIPLKEIFEDKNIEVVVDTISEAHLDQKELIGASGSRYRFDMLVLALGSETVYFNIPGLQDFSFGFKSIAEALRLRKHIHDLFKMCKISETDTEEDVCRMHIIIVGGGASGTELAGELVTYMHKLAKEHELDPSLITIDLIEAAPALLPNLPKDVSEKIKDRLHALGVNIFLNRTVTEQEIEEVHLKDINMRTKTVIWTAGMKPNHFFAQTRAFELDKGGRVIVNEHLEANKNKDVFVIGDAAVTQYVGMAQTAIHNGKFVADVIASRLTGKEMRVYKPKKPIYAIPIGHGWAAVMLGSMRLYGRIGWFVRRLADIRYFMSILPFKKAMLVFSPGKTLCESCSICVPEAE